MKLSDVRVMEVEYGEILDLLVVNLDYDVVFIWNGIMFGVCVFDVDWISVNWFGLIICDVIFVVFV